MKCSMTRLHQVFVCSRSISNPRASWNARAGWVIRIVLLLFCLHAVTGCDLFKDEEKGTRFPNSSEEIAEATQNAKQTASEAESTVEEAVEQALDADSAMDPARVAEEIENSEGVRSAETNADGKFIIVEQEDGIHLSVPTVQIDDERLFEQTSDAVNSGDLVEESEAELSRPSGSLQEMDEFPEGSKAVVLAPFERGDAFRDLSAIRERLESAGFDVDYYANGQANLDRFRGDFLAQYDLVVINTHGGVGKTIGGSTSTLLVTGERVTTQRNQSIKQEGLWSGLDAGEIGVQGVGAPLSWVTQTLTEDSDIYYAVTAPWMRATTDGEFPNTWIFADACDSAEKDSGPASLSQAFFDLGAGGYSGFDGTINAALANAVAEKLVALLGSGKSLNEASNSVRSDEGLQQYAWRLRLVPLLDDRARVGLLDESKRVSGENYYLFDPNRIVGTAEVIPSTGPPGTDVVYEVQMRQQFADEINRVEFYIDNTDELIEMEQITSTLWRGDNLSAPASEEYPRIDTFTFTAYDASENVIGTGAATFTIQEPEESNPTARSATRHSLSSYAKH